MTEDEGDALIKKIDQIRRKIGFDDSFITAAALHFRKLQESETNSHQDLSNLLMSKLFIDKMAEIYPTKRFKCQVTEESKWPVQVMPVECFGDTKFPDTYRLNCFYECLKISDVLDCRVAKVNPFDYHLRVIHKYGITSILDDLNITVVMPKSKNIMLLLKKELLSCELIRVKVTKITEKDGINIIYVTVEKDNCEIEELSKLGRLSEELLPPYVLNPHVAERFPSYSKYLTYVPKFKNPMSLNTISSDFGIDPYMMYSFYPEYNGSKCDESKTGQALLNQSKIDDARKYTLKATSASKENFSEALRCINRAIDLCPQKDKMLFSLYDIRASIHDNKNDKVSREAFKDWIKAYTLNSQDEDVKRSLSTYLFKLAYKSYKKKEYRDAFIKAEKAFEFNNHSDEARALIDYLKKKHAEIFFDQESLSTLQEKKMELVTELKKFEIKKEKK